MTSYLYSKGIRIFDFPQFAQALKEEIRDNASKIAVDNGLEIEFIRKIKAFSKDGRIKEIIKQRGEHPGLVHIFSAMETCTSYKPWYEKILDKPIFVTTMVNACTITFISQTKTLGYATCVFQPGCLSGCSFISTDITYWPANLKLRASGMW